jgi:hypothetical protein
MLLRDANGAFAAKDLDAAGHDATKQAAEIKTVVQRRKGARSASAKKSETSNILAGPDRHFGRCRPSQGSVNGLSNMT